VTGRRVWVATLAVTVAGAAVLALVAAIGTPTEPVAAAAPAVTYLVPAGQTAHESKPTLTGARQYSYLNPTYDRAAANNQPNRANLKGEAYLGDGGATATYTIKKLAASPTPLTLWIHYSDDAKHPAGARDVDITIPQLKWTHHWTSKPEDTKGWKAVKVATITTAGNITIRFRKTATTSAAFALNAFALTNAAATPPPFGYVVGAPTKTYDGAWAGTFKGTLGGQQIAGNVAATVAANRIMVTAPIKGTGTVSPTGAVSVAGAVSNSGVVCTYTGVLVVPPAGSTARPSVRSGAWTCKGPLTGTGTWEATRR
jgi:hypothetical protein